MSDNMHRDDRDRRDTNFGIHGRDQRDRSTTRIGGARRDRTDDLLLAKQALSQLSYGPSRCCRLVRMVGLGRLELPTSRLSSARSNQLSYKPGSFDPGSFDPQEL